MTEFELSAEDSSLRPASAIPGQVWPHGLWALGVFVLCGSWAITCWRLIDTHARQQAKGLEQAQQFYSELVREVHVLAGQSALTVTEDLCRVRFRPRLVSGLSPPAGTFSYSLAGLSGSDVVSEPSVTQTSLDDVVADFGLVPPGTYRLQIYDRIGMSCTCEFEVLPGVPVDRVAFCPDYQPWMFQEDSFTFRLQLDHRCEWESQPLLAVVHLCNGTYVTNGWRWEPPEQRQFCASALITAGDVAAEWDAVYEALPASILEEFAPIPLTPASDRPDCVVVPCGCCEVAGVSFVVAAPGDSARRWTHLATYLYESPEEHPQDVWTSDDIVVLSQERPRQVAGGSDPPVLEISLPRLVAPMIL